MIPFLRVWLLVLVAFTSGVACRPTLDDRPWLVTSLQIVGWKADPPEVAPGVNVALQVVALDPAGEPDTTDTAWSLCQTEKPLAESRVVSPDCLLPMSADAVGNPVQVTIPTDACRNFGPDTPQPAPGAPPTRPNDPDATGGYYQPMTVALGTSLAVGLERITCDLPDASLATATAFRAAYLPNQNPTISGLSFTVGGAPVDPMAVPPGARVTIEATWLTGAIETFPVFDPASGTIVETEETLVASWYVTGGDLDQAAEQVTDPTVLSTVADWTAPLSPATLELVLILRDSRGGSDYLLAALGIK